MINGGDVEMNVYWSLLQIMDTFVLLTSLTRPQPTLSLHRHISRRTFASHWCTLTLEFYYFIQFPSWCDGIEHWTMHCCRILYTADYILYIILIWLIERFPKSYCYILVPAIANIIQILFDKSQLNWSDLLDLMYHPSGTDPMKLVWYFPIVCIYATRRCLMMFKLAPTYWVPIWRYKSSKCIQSRQVIYQQM